MVCAASVMAAAAEESLSVATVVMSVPDSSGRSPEAEGGGAAGEKDAATKGTVAVGDSEEDGDDVFEVERILDMKCEGVCGGCAAGGPGRVGPGCGGAGRWGRIPAGRPTVWDSLGGRCPVAVCRMDALGSSKCCFGRRDGAVTWNVETRRLPGSWWETPVALSVRVYG